MRAKIRHYLQRLDWLTLALVAAILAVNTLVLASASANVVSGQPGYYLRRQLVWIAVGFCALFAATLIDYHKLLRFMPYLYVLTLLLLIGVLFMPAQSDAHRWYPLGFMDFQPSEFAKISCVLCFAAFLYLRQRQLSRPSQLLLAALLLAVPALLVLIEPDLGSAVIFFFIFVVMLFIAGVRSKLFLIALLILMVLLAGLFGLLYQLTDGYSRELQEEDIPDWLPLKAYQISRLIIFINPYMDPLGDGYHIIQSEIAIGSGGLLGKGYGQGSQVQGDFLPAHHTDFIFSVAGEEFGFLGTVTILLLYLGLFLRLLYTATRARDLYGSLVIGGITAYFAAQTLINIGMTVGLMPVTGITLPLMSYGGSSMLFNMLALGIVISINMHSQEQLF